MDGPEGLKVAKIHLKNGCNAADVSDIVLEPQGVQPLGVGDRAIYVAANGAAERARSFLNEDPLVAYDDVEFMPYKEIFDDEGFRPRNTASY